MNIEDLILVSVDDHVVEPPDVFVRHMPSGLRDKAPKVVRNERGEDVWHYEGRKIPNIATNAVAGRVPEEWGFEPTGYEQLRKGSYDVHARVEDMNANGVLGSMCFPSMAMFAGETFLRSKDRKLGTAVVQAYNDWHIDDWCGAYPGRFIPLGLLPLWDMELTGQEIRRLAGKGCHAVTVVERPTAFGLPSFHSDQWDPVWKACTDVGVRVAIHIGTGGGMKFASDDTPVDAAICTMPMTIVDCAADLLFSPVLRKWPQLKFALSEGGVGWIPYLLERADYTYEHHRRWTHQDFGRKLPSEIFREHFLTCFIDDIYGVRNRDAIGIDILSWECDYPHSDTTWPRSPELLSRTLTDLTDQEIRKITHENAIRFFDYNPFDVLAKKDCTVAALRSKAGHVSTKAVSTGGKPPTVDGEVRPVTAADVKKQLEALMQ